MAVRPPQYVGVCARHNCGAAGGFVIVCHVWPKTMHQVFRTKSNSTKLYPDIEACDTHKLSMEEIGRHFLNNGWLHVVQMFNDLGRGEPDKHDVLFELLKSEDALRMWADISVVSPADGHATVIEPASATKH